jgi:hypothetical protein
MNQDFERFSRYWRNVPEQPQKGIVTVSLRTDGKYLLFTLPNVGEYRFDRDSLRALAITENLPLTVDLLTRLIIKKSITSPVVFLKSGITALGLDNGYGRITVEYTDRRAFIGTIALSCRGLIG